MTREMGHWWLINAPPRVYVNCVDNFVRGLALSTIFAILFRLMLRLILTRRSEKQSSIGGKGETAEERRESLVCVETRVLNAQAHARRVWLG
jgi:hypothetical protein